MASAPPVSVAARPGWIARQAADPLLRSAYSLMLNVVVTSALGLGFWVAAAHLFSTAAVGRDSALVSAMLSLSAICQLNLASGIIRFLPITRLNPARVVIGAYAVAAGVSAAGGALFVLAAPRISDSYAFLGDQPGLAVLYVVAVAAWGVFALQDAVLTALRRAPWVPLENAVFGVMKIAALPMLLALGSAHAVFVAWVIPMVMLVVPVNVLIFRKVVPAWSAAKAQSPPVERSPVERFGWRGLSRFLAQDYVASILVQAGTTMLPVLIVGVVGTRQGAYFYMPFTIVCAFDLLFLNVASSLTVEGALAESRLSSLTRAVVGRFGWLLAGGVAVLVAGATSVLLPFGAEYVSAGAPVLRLLALASAFRAVVALFGGICRVEGRASRILAVQAATFAMVIPLTVVLGGSHGLQGVALGWLLANAVAACAVAARVVNVLRG